MISGNSWIGSSYEVVYMSAVILLHQVCDVSKMDSAITVMVAADIVCTCMQHRSVIKHVSTLHVSCSDVHYTALHADIALRSVLALASYFVV